MPWPINRRIHNYAQLGLPDKGYISVEWTLYTAIISIFKVRGEERSTRTQNDTKPPRDNHTLISVLFRRGGGGDDLLLTFSYCF